ncbi:MAG: response regulator transcription factor [Fusobacteria bacterium]|nr:response regulator transcription factor [Fusobacteriota bacterium]
MKKNKILYLDDEVELLEFVKFVLEYNNYEVIVGENWDKSYFEILSDVDMIILDVMFSNGNACGYDICKIIRAKEKYSKIPIYMFSAKTFHEDKIKAQEAGANGFIEKPVEVKELLSIVESVVNRENINALL